MARFYLHVCDGAGFVEDDEGEEHPDIAAARNAAVEGLRDILAAELRRGDLNTASFVEIEDEDRHWVATVSFEDVVRLTSDVPARPKR